MIAIIDYGAGNLRSVINAFEGIGHGPQVTTNPADLKGASAIVLPGVGSFGDGMKNLRRTGMVEALNEEVIVKKKPYLGICLGLQFLAEVGLEHGEHEGLGWVKGKVVRLEPDYPSFRVPHIGWNDLDVREMHPLFENLEDGPVFYFVHSYHLKPRGEDLNAVTATCLHGQVVTAAVRKENIFGVQFHPEKSQRSGLTLLKNFVNYISQEN